QGAGFLGNRFAPMLIEADSAKEQFVSPSTTLPIDLSLDRLRGRQSLLEQLNQYVQRLEKSRQLDELQSYKQQAFGLISSPQVGRAFDVDRESQQTRGA